MCCYLATRRGSSMLMEDLSIADQLRELGEHGVLVTMAENGLLAELRCALDRNSSTRTRPFSWMTL